MIHSENFQALQLLQTKYKGKIKYIYIDPPYNAKSSEILYKNNYKHSSWLSLIENRTTLACKLLHDDSVTTTAIDDVENERLGLLLDQIYGLKYSGKATVNVVINPSDSKEKFFCHKRNPIFLL